VATLLEHGLLQASLPFALVVIVNCAIIEMPKLTSLYPQKIHAKKQRPYRNVFNKMNYRPRVQAFAWNLIIDPH